MLTSGADPNLPPAVNDKLVMVRNNLKTLLAGLALPILSFPVGAHHSPAPYDLTQEVVYEGTVSELLWRNPHIVMVLETTNTEGQLYELEVEVVSVSEARALGLTREVISEGERLSLRAHPGRRTGSSVALGIHVTSSDGRIFPLRTDATLTLEPPAVPATSLEGHWAPTLDSYNDVFPTYFEPLELTEAGELAREAAQERSRAVGAEFGICEPLTLPLLSIFYTLRTIEIDEDEILINFQGNAGRWLAHTVYLGEDEHPADLEPTLMGHSIGHWEGDTLVIDTIGFSPHPQGGFGNTYGFISSSEKHLVERLTLAEDRLSLKYEVMMEDPVNMVNPVTFSATWRPRPDLEFEGVDCDPDLARRISVD